MKKASAALAALVTALSGVLQAVPAVTAYAAGSSENNYTYDGYTVSYRVADAWGDTERIAVTLTNTGADTLENWMLYFRPNGTAYGFNGIQKAYTAAEIAYFRNAGYNDSLAPGESTTFEYLVDHCEAAPARFSLCQTRTEKTGGYEVSLSSYSAWGSNFNGVIHIHNTSDQPISAWELTFDTNYTITAIPNSWAAEVTSLGVGRYLMKGIYNDVIAPGETLELGFIAEKNGTPVLDSYSLTEVTADEAYLHQLALGGQYSISDLEDMNADSVYPLEIEQDDDGTVSVIDGKFSDVTVTDGESAKDSLTGVQELLGIGSISSELALDWIYEDPDGDFKSYYFNQVYQGVPVFGRTVTVVVGSSGETLSVDCGYEPINGLSADWVYSAETVAAALDADTAEACIYANGAYADAPVPAYLVMNNVMRSVVSAADMQVLYQKPVVYEYGTNDYSDYDMDFEYPDKPGKYFHRAPSFWKEPVPDEASARALALSQPLAVDFSDASPMNTLSAYSHFQYTNYEKAYHFDQRFNSVLVYGREVLVAARKSDNKLYSFESNVVEIPEDFSTMPSQELIDRKGGRTAFLVIYTWDENENDAPPQLAYIYKDEDNKHTHIILEDDEWVKDLGVGLDEGCCVNIGTEDEPDYQPRPMKLHYFPITKVTEVSDRGLYKMSVLKEELGIDDGGKQLKIEMRLAGDTAQNDMTTSTIRTDHTNMDNAYFYAPQAVSAYVNLIQISKWYAFSPGIRRAVYTDRSKSNLNINKGDIVCAIDSVYDPKEDTAYANYMYMCTGVKRHMPYTYGVSAIVLGHEFTHGVFGTFCDFDAYYFTARGINEGYADVFGELIGENWDSGYEAKGNYAVTDGRSGRSAVFHGADLNDAFYDESYQLVPHIVKPAYLLETEYGFTKRMIAALYYKSLSMGSYLDGAKQDPEDENALPIREGRGSTLNSFRSRLLRAAKASKYTNQMMQSLVSAFNEAWGTARFFYETDLNLVDAETNEPIDPAQATVRFHPYDETISYDTPWSVHGKYVGAGYYSMRITVDGYIPYRQEIFKRYQNETFTVQLVRSIASAGEMVVCAHDFVDRLPHDCTVIIKRADMDGDTAVGSYQTGAAVGAAEGYTAPITLPAGYYTASVAGAEDDAVKPVYVAGGARTVVPVHYYAVNVNQNDRTVRFSFDVAELKEHVPSSSYPTDFTLGCTPRFDHVYDPTGQRILYTTTTKGQVSNHMQVYCYERRQESFAVYLELTNADLESLRRIAEYDAATGIRTYMLEIDFQNHQVSSNQKTFMLNAAQLRAAALANQNRVPLGSIQWKLESGGYVFNPVYYA